ncbi:MAG: sulfatase-like hydrolase/transferase, partial [Phycisphaeraceae bacterium]
MTNSLSHPRPFRFTKLLLTALLLAASIWMPPQARGAERQPNVIVIYSDDQGSIDAACYGAKDLVTPGIDMLASRGVRFTQFYSAAPVCSPSRAGLLTGRYPWLCGMPSNASAPPSEAIDDLTKADNPDGKAEFAAQTTMAEMFK